MLMRPAPPQATGPSPRIATVDATSQRVHPGLEQPPRTAGPRIGPKSQPQPLAPSSPTYSPVPVEGRPALRPLYPDTPQHRFAPCHRQPAAGSRLATLSDNGAASPRHQALELGAVDHRSIPRPRRGRPHAGDGKTRRRSPRLRGGVASDAEDRHHGYGGGCGSRIPEVPDRVPFHAAFADDPAFHRPDQEVVADDNTEENHRRRAPPRSDNLSDYDCAEGRRDVQVLSEITETSADTADTARRIPGTRHRRRYKVNNDATPTSDEKHAAETEEEKAFESRWRSAPESREEGLSPVQEPRSVDGEPEAAGRGENRGVDAAQVPRATGSERRQQQQQFRRRRIRRIGEKTCGLLFVLYLFALPIICATNGSPPGDRGSLLAFAHNARSGNSSPGSEERQHPYRDYSWEVNQINPWLSACDLAGPAPADLQGSCGPPETPKNCPDACVKQDARASRAADSFFAVVSQAIEYRGFGDRDRGGGGGVPRPETGGRSAPEQCLFYLEESHRTEICRDDFGKDSSERFQTVRQNRYRFLSGLRLRHCCEHAALNALASGDGGPLEEVLGGNDGCRKAIGKLLAVDALAARLHCEFGEVLARYDCGQPYSVIYNCSHCKEAYRRWVCSSLVPYFAHDDQPPDENQGPAGPRMGTGMRIRPCRSFCQTVEQRCPYLLPGDRAPAYPTQYAGEPTFLCRDPNIPETGEQASRALHADEECCFHVCSDEDPGLGVCANCTEPQIEIAIRGGSARRDPSTAPQCELNSPSSTSGHHQPATSGGTWSGPSSTTTEDGSLARPASQDGVESLDVSSGASHHSSSSGSGTSFCGSGGVGSMSSASAPRPAPPSITMCAFCAWGVLIGLCTIKVATSWTTSESSLIPVRSVCTEIISGFNRRRRRRRRLPPAKTLLRLVIFGCSVIGSLLIGAYDALARLSTVCRDLIGVKLLRRTFDRYNDDLLPAIDDIEDRRFSGNSTRSRGLRRRGCKRRRKKKRRRAS